MRYINVFFETILAIQCCFERLEVKVKRYKKYIQWLGCVGMVVAVLLLVGRKIVLGNIIFIFTMILLALESIIGWKQSVRKWLNICLVYNLYFSITLTSIIQGYVKYNISIGVFITLYSFIWLFLSLISNSEVSLLVNEIISGFAATVFTIGTYLTSAKLEMLSSISYYESYFINEKALEDALISGNELAWQYFEAELLNGLQTLFMAFLPIIGISALCIIFVKVKVYWLKKNKKKEPEDIDIII